MDEARIDSMLTEVTQMLGEQKNSLTLMLAKSIPNINDRTRAISLANQIFSVNHKMNNPNQWQADQIELQEIVKQYGADSTGG